MAEPPPRTIIVHGSGFSYGDAGRAVDDYIVAQSSKPSPVVLFLPHTTDDAPRYCTRFHDAFRSRRTINRTLSLFTPEVDDIESFIMEADIIYVGGGNTKSLLALWREWGCDRFIRDAYANGTILTGMSAGAICWFEHGFSDSLRSRYIELPGLGLLPGILNPHHVGERRFAFAEAMRTSRHARGWGLPDGCLIHFHNEAPARFRAGIPGAVIEEFSNDERREILCDLLP